MSPIKILILKTLAMLIWASTEELAVQVGRHRTTVLRHLRELSETGLVEYRIAGRSPTALQRWLLSTDGVYQVFPERHSHPGPRDRHRHDPKFAFLEGHSHPSYWNSQKGAADLWGSRLQLMKFLYPLATTLFKGDFARFHPEGIEAKLVGFRWLEHGRLVVAAGEYEGGVNVFFAWVPLEFTDSMVKHRWNVRTAGLVVQSEDDDEPYDWQSPPDPDHDGAPRPSLTVLIAEDPGAAVVARRVLVDGIRRGTRAWPLLRVCLSRPEWRHLEGLILTGTDNVWDPFRDLVIGEPEKLCQQEEDEHDGD